MRLAIVALMLLFATNAWSARFRVEVDGLACPSPGAIGREIERRIQRKYPRFGGGRLLLKQVAPGELLARLTTPTIDKKWRLPLSPDACPELPAVALLMLEERLREGASTGTSPANPPSVEPPPQFPEPWGPPASPVPSVSPGLPVETLALTLSVGPSIGGDGALGGAMGELTASLPVRVPWGVALLGRYEAGMSRTTEAGRRDFSSQSVAPALQWAWRWGEGSRVEVLMGPLLQKLSISGAAGLWRVGGVGIARWRWGGSPSVGPVIGAEWLVLPSRSLEGTSLPASRLSLQIGCAFDLR